MMMLRSNHRCHFRNREEFDRELDRIEADVRQELAALEPIDLDAVFNPPPKKCGDGPCVCFRLSWADIITLAIP
jgi:hypothetical protein